MDFMETAKKGLCALDSVVLSPSMTLGLSSYNKNTGSASGSRSITISTTTTLLKMLIFLLSLMLFFRTARSMMRMKNMRYYKKLALKKLKKHRKS